MINHKLPNNFYSIEPPVKIWYNWRKKYWRLLDNNDTIIADNLTKELAETLMQAVNLCAPAIDFTKFFVEWEHVVENREDASHEDVGYRNAMHDQALTFMVKLGLVDPPPKYTNAFPLWRNQLMKDFYERINKCL